MAFMGSRDFRRTTAALVSLFLLFLPVQSIAGTVRTGTVVDFVFPGDGVEVVARKPPVRCVFSVPVSNENLLVRLDGVDITGALDFTPEGFEFLPVQALPSGAHQLHVTLSLDNGEEINLDFFFNTVNQGFFDQATSENQFSGTYEQVLKKPSETNFIPHQNLSANITSTNLAARDNWEIGLNTNLRYLERSAPLLAPEKKGLDLVDYLLSARYSGENLSVLTEVGDLQLQETQNTIMGLARRGARTAIKYNNLSLSSFMVQSEQVFGFDDGLKLDFEESDNIMGVVGGIKFFSDTLTLRTIYVTGGEKGSSFGLYSEGGAREGSTLGFQLLNQLWEGKLNIEAEYDIADFDADTGDEFSSDNDRAWTLKAGGYVGGYNYQVIYEYIGPDYEVIGNQGMQRDREGLTVTGGIQKEHYALNLMGSSYEDNVKDDNLFPQVRSSTAMADYSFTRFQSFPMGLSYQRSIVDSTMVPEFGVPVKIYTDMITARLNHQRDAWNYSLNASYSTQDDRTSANYDTRAQSYNFSPSYYSEHFSFSPNLAFNRATDETSGVDTDTYTLTADLRGDVFSGKCLYEFAGTFSRMEMNNGAMKTDILNTNFRIAYVLGGVLFDSLNPSIGLVGMYNRTDDKVFDQTNDEFVLLLAISTSLGISF